MTGIPGVPIFLWGGKMGTDSLRAFSFKNRWFFLVACCLLSLVTFALPDQRENPVRTVNIKVAVCSELRICSGVGLQILANLFKYQKPYFVPHESLKF